MSRSISFLAAGLCAALALGTASSAGTSAPALRLTAMQPLTIGGAAFKSRELVTVRVTRSNPPAVRRSEVRATRLGAFTVQVADLRVGRCSGLAVRATGARGSVATLKRPPLPACIQE